MPRRRRRPGTAGTTGTTGCAAVLHCCWALMASASPSRPLTCLGRPRLIAQRPRRPRYGAGCDSALPPCAAFPASRPTRRDNQPSRRQPPAAYRPPLLTTTAQTIRDCITTTTTAAAAAAASEPPCTRPRLRQPAAPASCQMGAPYLPPTTPRPQLHPTHATPTRSRARLTGLPVWLWGAC
jgi:hypothetical protein